MVSSRTTRVNTKLKAIHSAIPIEDLSTVPNIATILQDHPHRTAVRGYYARLPVSEIAVTVPDVEKVPDRHGQTYTGGLFNAPLLTLSEWHRTYKRQNNSQPDLLVNANWYNIWESGQPKVGSKMALRQVARTFLVGLSISNGKMVSSHTTLDQGVAPLDSIFFDEDSKQVHIVPHNRIEEMLEKFKDKKINAVSGFITLSDNQPIPSPEENNNIHLRLPRTGIGLSQDGKEIIVMSVYNRYKDDGVNASELANLLQALGCKDVINLDNSGSVELLYRGPNIFGNQIEVQTQTCDARPDPEKPGEIITDTPRPKPNFLGFRRKSKPHLFFKDDSDVLHEEQQSRERKLSR